jgi:MerR family mercuric resistance operon transcriptional regulator
MRIGELAKASGVGVETVRFYEDKGLVDRPQRPRDGGYRAYSAGAVNRIRFIRSAQALGFSLAEVGELLALESVSSAQCGDVRRRARLKRDEVQQRIENLAAIRAALDRLIEACPGAGPARDCSILDAINSGELNLRGMTKEK